jgi:glutathione S-transferase
MILYGHPLSGNTHKVRLLLSALGLRYEERAVDVTTGAHKSADFIALNPRGQLPVLADGDALVYDAQAILVYLARKYDANNQWLPGDAKELAQVVAWLSFAANEIHNGVHVARMHFLLGTPVALDQAHAIAGASLSLLEGRLRARRFLELERPTIADLACFPCVGLAPEGQVSLQRFPGVRAWMARLSALPCYLPMPGLQA